MEWIDVKVKQPPKDRAILVCTPGYQIDIGFYDKKRACFMDYYYKQDITDVILFWMELPKLPE